MTHFKLDPDVDVSLCSWRTADVCLSEQDRTVASGLTTWVTTEGTGVGGVRESRSGEREPRADEGSKKGEMHECLRKMVVRKGG